MLRGLPTQTFREVAGRYNRGPDKENISPRYLQDEKNLVFTDDGAQSRPGYVSYLSAPGSGPVTKWNGSVKRMREYKRINEASRLLILDNSGNLYDSSDLTVPILTVASMADFAMVVLYNRAYISPSDGKRGLTGEKVYVYTGTGSARAAACSPPSGYTLVAANGTSAGHIDKGDHLFSVVFQTESGAISKMGLTGNECIKWTADGTKSCKLTGIPTGPSYVTKRMIVATRVLKDYNGDPKLQGWFFVPNGTISDNVTTQLDNINFYDGDLADDAGYLLYNLSTIPAGAILGSYNNRLVVGGEATSDCTVRFSSKAQPESISDLDGTIIVDPGDLGGGVKNFIEHRGQFYITKSQRTYVTSENGSVPQTWSISLIDGTIGAEPSCISALADGLIKGSRDIYLVADRSAFFIFNGSYGAQVELSYPIADDWRRINPNYFHLVQVAVDTVLFRIYIAVPLDGATEPSHVFMCSYHEGLSADKVKWSIWSLAKKPTSILLKSNYTSGLPELMFGSSELSIYRFDSTLHTDDGSAIDSYVEFKPLWFSDSNGLSLFTALRVRATGSGNLLVTLYGPDNTLTTVLSSLPLASSSGPFQTRLANFVAQHLSVKLGVNSVGSGTGDWFELRTLIIAGSEYWQELPD